MKVYVHSLKGHFASSCFYFVSTPIYAVYIEGNVTLKVCNWQLMITKLLLAWTSKTNFSLEVLFIGSRSSTVVSSVLNSFNDFPPPSPIGLLQVHIRSISVYSDSVMIFSPSLFFYFYCLLFPSRIHFKSFFFLHQLFYCSHLSEFVVLVMHSIDGGLDYITC